MARIVGVRDAPSSRDRGSGVIRVWDYVVADPHRALAAGLAVGAVLLAVIHAVTFYFVHLRHRAVVYYAAFLTVFLPVPFLAALQPGQHLQEFAMGPLENRVFHGLAALSVVFFHLFFTSGYGSTASAVGRLHRFLPWIAGVIVATRIGYGVSLGIPILRVSIALMGLYVLIVLWLCVRMRIPGKGGALFKGGLLALLIPVEAMILSRLGLVPGAETLPSLAIAAGVGFTLFCVLWLHGFAAVVRDQDRRRERLALIGMFAAEFVHEVSNPIMSLEFCLSQMDSGKRGGSAQPAKDQLQRNIDSINALLGNLRSMMRGVGHAEPFAVVSSREIVSRAVDLVRPPAARASIAIQEAGEDYAVRCRRMELAQAVANLIANSVDAVRALPERWIRVSVTMSEGRVGFAVRDSGDGVLPENRARIMTPFFTTKDAGAGTGLGLSFAKRVAEDHGGHLRYNDQCPNTEFVLSVPHSEVPAPTGT